MSVLLIKTADIPALKNSSADFALCQIEDLKLSRAAPVFLNSEVGNVVVGKVTSVKKNLGCSFVDYGGEKNGILDNSKHFVGASVFCKVERDASGDKGAKLTEKISVAGKYVVVLPFERGTLLFSKKFTNEALKKSIREEFKNSEYGFIFRSCSALADLDELKEEAERLKSVADKIKTDGAVKKTGTVFSPDKLIAAVCDFGIKDDETLILDSEIPDLGLPYRTEYLDKDSEEFKAALSDFSRAFASRVELMDGVELVIEKTEAFLSVDVNSKGSVGLPEYVNAVAARELCRQLKITNPGGVIVVDFITVKEDGLSKIIEILKSELETDKIYAIKELCIVAIVLKKCYNVF